MTINRLLLSATLLLTVTGIRAQHEIGSITIQPKAGMNVANITNDDDATSRIGLAFGAEIEYQMTDIVSISAGAIYSMQGAKAGVYTEDFSKADATLKLDYINIPVLVNVYVTKNLAVKAGLQPAFNVTHKIKAEAYGISAEANVPGTRSIDLSIPIGLSYEFLNFVIDGRYNFGVTDFVDEQKSKNSVFQFTVGYKFDI